MSEVGFIIIFSHLCGRWLEELSGVGNQVVEGFGENETEGVSSDQGLD